MDETVMVTREAKRFEAKFGRNRGIRSSTTDGCLE
jgi:hypothetical protein